MLFTHLKELRNQVYGCSRSAFPSLPMEREMGRAVDTYQLGVMVVILVLCLASLPLTLGSFTEQLSSRECEDLGFSGLALCSDCHTLAEYIKDQDLVSDCMKCCTEDSEDELSKITYSGAILEVCMRKLVFYTEIVSFIEEQKNQFPFVKVEYSFNSAPKLLMLDNAGQQKETIRIDNWKREHIVQFLREKVKPTSAI